MKFSGLIVLVVGLALSCNSPASQAAMQSSAATVIVPDKTWDCGMPGGIPNPESGTLIFQAEVKLGNVWNVGKTPFGNRRVAVAQEGVFSGAKVSGTVMPGALDFELQPGNGIVEIEQIFVLKTASGNYIYLRTAGTGANSSDVRIVMDFEAPNAGDFSWLNTGRFVGRRVFNEASKVMTLRVYDVSAVALATDSASMVRITKPAGVPAQPWDYRKAATSEKQGALLITETVTLSPSQSVGLSKRGNRNIIPITGGEVTGRISGKVLFGGADYQNLSSPATIDARYLWQANDGEVVIVRNAGTFGSLVPTFEARIDGPYAWLNGGSYLSSNPSMRPGGVGITMFESTRQ
jgi:hypothetical protein